MDLGETLEIRTKYGQSTTRVRTQNLTRTKAVFCPYKAVFLRTKIRTFSEPGLIPIVGEIGNFQVICQFFCQNDCVTPVLGGFLEGADTYSARPPSEGLGSISFPLEPAKGWPCQRTIQYPQDNGHAVSSKMATRS